MVDPRNRSRTGCWHAHSLVQSRRPALPHALLCSGANVEGRQGICVSSPQLPACMAAPSATALHTLKHLRPGLRQAVASDREREELLVDHLKDRERREREAKRAEQKKRMAAFRALLESSSFIKVGAWGKFQEFIQLLARACCILTSLLKFLLGGSVGTIC